MNNALVRPDAPISRSDEHMQFAYGYFKKERLSVKRARDMGILSLQFLDFSISVKSEKVAQDMRPRRFVPIYQIFLIMLKSSCEKP